MNFPEFDNIVRKAKVLIVNPQVATYACIGITTSMLAYFTLFEKSKPEQPSETSSRSETPVEEEEEEASVEEEEEEAPVEEEEEAPVEEEEAKISGGKKKKTRYNKKKEKKNKSRRKSNKK